MFQNIVNNKTLAYRREQQHDQRRHDGKNILNFRDCCDTNTTVELYAALRKNLMQQQHDQRRHEGKNILNFGDRCDTNTAAELYAA